MMTNLQSAMSETALKHILTGNGTLIGFMSNSFQRNNGRISLHTCDPPADRIVRRRIFHIIISGDVGSCIFGRDHRIRYFSAGRP